MRKGVQFPITAGQIVAAYSASSVNDTNWHSLNSSDFYNPITGTQLASDLQFAYIGAVSSNSTTSSFIKLRAAAGAGDGKTNSDGVIEIQSSYSVDVAAVDGGDLVTDIAYAKAAGSDKFTLYCGFNVK
jgi:hypothetical protein